MVVITIIGILATLLTVAGFAFVVNAQEAATATTITKIDEAILERVSAINRYHERPISRLRKDWEQRGWPQRWKAYGLSQFAGVAGTSPGWADAAQMVLSRKGMMMEAFPITQSELKQCYWFWAQFRDSNPADSFEMINQVRVPYLSGDATSGEQGAMNTFLLDIDKDATNNTAASGKYPGKPSTLDLPSEIFLYALKNAPVFGGLPMTEDEFSEDELIDQDEDGLPELADAWENPLRFYRWPTRLVNNGESVMSDVWSDNPALVTLMPNAPVSPPGTPPAQDSLKQDPDDPAGYLSVINPLLNKPIVYFFHDTYTWHAPLVVSAGPDGELGLAEPQESLPVPFGETQLERYGMARPLTVNASEISGETVDANATEQLFDNISNHNSDGGL